MAFASSYDRSASELIISISDITKPRRNGKQRGPAVIFVIDNLADHACERMDYDVFVHFKWLLKEGPKSMVCPIITLNADQIKLIDKRLISPFSTLIVSNIHSPKLASETTRSNQSGANNLASGYQFEVLYTDEWIRFAIPSIVE